MEKNKQTDREPAMITQIKELDDVIEECIQRLSNETTGTGLKVLIAEFEELMFLKTKLLTQMVIADQQVKHICKRFGYASKPKDRKMVGRLKSLKKDREHLRKQLKLLAKISKSTDGLDYDEIASITNSMNNTYETLMKSEIVLFAGFFVCTHLLACFFIHVKKLFWSNA